MFRFSTLFRTLALHQSCPFIDGALQLRKLHIAHKQASEDLLYLLRHHSGSSAALSSSSPSTVAAAATSSHGSLPRNSSTSGRKKKKKQQRETLLGSLQGEEETITPPPPPGSGNSSISPKASKETWTHKTIHNKKAQDLQEQQEALCVSLEREFLREVETFRPIFTASAMLVSREYSQYVYRAMRYFGCSDDPLMRQLSTLLGRSQLKERQQQERGGGGVESWLLTKRKTKGGECMPGVTDPLEERVVTVLPTELPHPPQVSSEHGHTTTNSSSSSSFSARRRPGALRFPAAYRGHWVLQEPEIAITREERREDPW